MEILSYMLMTWTVLGLYMYKRLKSSTKTADTPAYIMNLIGGPVVWLIIVCIHVKGLCKDMSWLYYDEEE